MAKQLTQRKVMDVLDWAYVKAVDGVPGLGSAQDLATDYLKRKGPLREKINSLIRWQNTKCATSGFLSGLGGVLTLPVAVPANIASVIYVQIRMIAAIAHMCGQDVKNDRVKTIVYTCLLGNSAKDVFKEIGIGIGTKLTNQAIKNISREIIAKINRAVGFRLLTKFGQKGAINLSKGVPIVGGVIGGTIDCLATNTIGNVARDRFCPKKRSRVRFHDQRKPDIKGQSFQKK